jgi:hypothetical protein
VSVRTFLDVYKSLMRQPTVDSIIHCMDRLQSRSVSPLFEYVCAVAYLEICKGGGGAARIFGDPFFRTQTNLQNSRPKKFLRLFFSNFSHFFPLHSVDLLKNPAKRQPPHHESQLRGGAVPDRLQHRPRQRGGRSHHRPPKYATAYVVGLISYNSGFRSNESNDKAYPPYESKGHIWLSR